MTKSDNDQASAVITVFGITGDLAKRKLLPALYHLLKQDLLPRSTPIVGISRSDTSVDTLLEAVELCVLEEDNICDPVVLRQFRENLTMVQVDPGNESEYQRLANALDNLDVTHDKSLDRLFYLSIPPNIYTTVVENLGKSPAVQRKDDRNIRLLVEKPFGSDVESAEKLIATTAKYFDESEIFRIDHFLAKGTAQNILTFRDANPLFADVWNSRHIDSIEVIASETLGVAGRGGFYDDAGALRDSMQNHLIQLMTLATLDIPPDITDATLKDAKNTLLRDVRVREGTETLRMQYDGYLEDIERFSSKTETLAAVHLQIDNERWKGTDVLLATGKKLSKKYTWVRLHFKDTEKTPGNYLTFRLDPNEGIDITLQVRKPGYAHDVQPALLDYDYTHAKHPDAYERVLMDALKGDHLLFAGSEEIMASWRILQPVISKWRDTSEAIRTYASGTDLQELIQ